MDGLHSLKTVWRTAWFRFPARKVMAVATGSACLLLVSGCAFSRNMLNGPTPAVAPAAPSCTHPDCAAPNAATATTMTAMPVAQVAPAQVQPVAQVPAVPTPGQVPVNAVNGTAAAASPLPQVPVPYVPPGWKLTPDVPPAVPPAGFMTEERLRQQAECLNESSAGAPVEWPVDEKLLRCERQVAEMTEKIMGLQNVTEVTKQAMLSMELEQIRLRNENEALRRRADESHREVIKSIDSLSEYMDEMVPAEVTSPKPVPTASDRRTAKPVEQTSVLPPVDEEL